MEEGMKGKVFDIQRYTLNDGPGIRTEIFLQGCPLCCRWCHSPDSQDPKGELAWFPIQCVGIKKCGACLKACQQEAITEGEKIYSKFVKEEIQLPKLDRNKCNKCGKCAAVCYPKAFYMTCQEKAVSEIMEVIKKDQDYYYASGGGVTISGGEPLVQADFAREILKESKRLGLNTALDTSGDVSWGSFEKVLDYVDLYLYDLKSMIPEISEILTGKSNELILDNLRKLSEFGKKIQIRYPLIPGLNDQKENVERTADFCASLGNAVTAVQLLPYHRLGAVKYERIGRKYSLSKLQPMKKEEAEKFRNAFEKYGIQTFIG